MARDFLTLPIDELLDEFARETRVPGAGPAAALATAAAAALVAMAALSSPRPLLERPRTSSRSTSLQPRTTTADDECWISFGPPRRPPSARPTKCDRLLRAPLMREHNRGPAWPGLCRSGGNYYGSVV